MNAVSFTRYLVVRRKTIDAFVVQILTDLPAEFLQNSLKDSHDLRYSPIMAAYLLPDVPPPKAPERITSISYFFHRSPYKALGCLKSKLQKVEVDNTHFTEGLASILIFNIDSVRTEKLSEIMGGCHFEFWQISSGELSTSTVKTKIIESKPSSKLLQLPTTTEAELSVYVEQIAASLSSLWVGYGIYFPEEQKTLFQLAEATRDLLNQYSLTTASQKDVQNNLAGQKQANSIISALIELSATLSYAVTQGLSGAAPILSNRSPFPHHSLLGIGSSVRALTRYTRYLEEAFMVRSAGEVLANQYSYMEEHVSSGIPKYSSGPEYRFSVSGEKREDIFDRAGEANQEDNVPLIAHFSLRHGFMESKFSVTAASESLTAETMPQWTLVTLSHEIMHSRVRTIFQALFGFAWNEETKAIIPENEHDSFKKWAESQEVDSKVSVKIGLRNAILCFCRAIDEFYRPRTVERYPPDRRISIGDYLNAYAGHKQLAIELVVHFHDYYFCYACQPRMYMMSIWASWIKVAAPYVRTSEYLVRSLAAVACGTGLKPRDAFKHAVEVLTEGLDELESKGIRSPLFSELRRLVSSNEEKENIFLYFKACYYLIDHINLYFSSTKIASKIDRITKDPFSDGSHEVQHYSANTYVFAEEDSPSPIRYSLAALFHSLKGSRKEIDSQWLSAWNYMVISS